MADIGIKISAIDAASGVFKTVSSEAGKLQGAVGNVSAALATMGVGLSAGAFLAFVKNINDGVDALNDLKDATGASIENISALEDVALRTGSSFDTVSTALIKLNKGLSDAKPGSGAERAITAIGLSVAELKALDPAEAFRRIAVGLSNFEDDANKARLTQELFGKSIKEVAPLLKDLADQSQLNATVTTAQAEAAETLNKQFFALQKNATDLARSLVNDLVPSLSALSTEMAAVKKTSLGFFDGALTQLLQNPFKSATENAAKYREELASLEAARQRFMKGGNDTSSLDAAIATMRRRLAYFKEIELAQIKYSPDDESAAEKARLGIRKQSVADISGDIEKDAAAKKEAAAAAAAAAKALALQNRELAEQAKLLATLSGVNGDYQEQLTRLQAVRKNQNLSDARYNELVTELIGKQPMVKALYTEQEKAAKAWADQSAASAKAVAELTKEYDAYVKTLDNSAAAVANQVLKLQDEETATIIAAQQNISLAQAIEQVTIARLAEAQTKAYANGDQEAGDAIKREIKEREKLATLIGGKEAREAAAKTAKEAAAEWQKTADKINDNITDALMRGFESGKGFAENLRDTVVNMFETMELRPTVSAIVNPVAQGVTGMLGLGGAANAANAAGSASNAYTAYGTFAGGASAFGSAFTAGATVGTEAFSAGLTMMTEATGASSFMAGAGQALGAIGPVGWAALAAVAVLSLQDHGKPTSSTGDASASFDAQGNRTAYQTFFDGSSAAVDKMLSSLQASYAGAAKSLGIGTVASEFAYGGNTGKNGESPNFALTSRAGNSSFTTGGETASSDAAISLAASRAVFAALQGSDLPAYLVKVFNGVTADAMSQDQITNTLAYAASLKQVRDALLETREPMAVLQSNVDKAFADMATSADTFKADFVAAIDGGISPEKLAQWQSLQTSMTDLAALAKKDADAKDAAAKTIRDNIEKEAGIVKTWAEKLAVLDGTTTDRKLSLEADMLTTNNASTKALIERVYTLEDEKAAIEKLTETNKGWKDQLDVLTGAETERSLALRDTTDASTKALMEQVYAQQDLKTAIDAAVTSQNSLVEKYKSPLNADTASQALGSDVVAMFAGKSADAIREMALNYAVSLDTQTEAGRAAVKQLAELAPAIDYFASAADKAATASANAAQALIDQRKALTDQLFDLTATDAEKAKRARDAIDPSNLDVYDKVIAAQLAVKTATESATAAAAAFAKQMQRFGSGLDLRFDLAGSGGANAPKAVATYLRGIVDAAITSTANFQAGFASGMFDQSSLITQATANTESRTNAALQATLRLRGFFEGMANDAAGIEKAIADSGTNIGKGVQALNVSQYFTDFAAELTAAVGEINRAMQDSAGTLADSATILAGVTSGSTGFVQGILDNVAGEMTSINASDLTALVQSVGGGATQIGAAITQSILNSVSASVKDNAAFAGLGGADLAYVSAVVSGVGQGDIQGINDAFLLLSGALTTGRIDATAYQEALNLVTTGFLTGADAATKIASAADILKQAGEFADRLAVANGTKTQLEISRKNELTTALDANNRATLLAIYAAEDLAAANTKAAEDARAAASNAMQGASDALSGLQRAVDAQKKLAQVQVDVASESVNNLKSIFDSLKGNIATLYGEVDSTSKYTANSGNAFITQALATAKATGYLPDAKDLGDAVSAAMAGASNTVYASQADADFAKLSLAGSLSGLKDISGTQLTAAEQTLKSAQDQLSVLDATYENAKLQLDAANNINTSVLSVADALRAFGVSLSAAQNAKVAQYVGTPTASLSAAQNAKVAQYVGTPTASVPRGSRSYIDAAAGTTQLAGNASPMATSELASSVVASWALGKNDPAIEDNVRRFMRDLELTPGALGISLPGFAQGINYVPHDMFARIHEGEAVVPKAYNPAAGGSSNARLEALVEGLTKEVQRLQQIVNTGNVSNERIASAVNGNPDMPILVQTV